MTFPAYEVESLLVYLALWVMIFGLLGMAIGRRKGRSGAGFFFGALLGPLGWLLITVGPDYSAEAVAAKKGKKCPFCAEVVKEEAIVCKHCGRDLMQVRATGAPKVRSSQESFEEWQREQKRRKP